MNKEYIVNAAMNLHGLSREEAEEVFENVSAAVKKIWNAIKAVVDKLVDFLERLEKEQPKIYHSLVKDLRKPSQVSLRKPRYSHALK